MGSILPLTKPFSTNSWTAMKWFFSRVDLHLIHYLETISSAEKLEGLTMRLGAFIEVKEI